MAGETITILIVDDHPLVRAGLVAVLNAEPDFSVVAQASSGTQAVQQHRLHKPAVTLMDIKMNDGDGVAATREIMAESPSAKIIIITTYDGDASVYRALEAGASAYLLKDMLEREVIDAIRTVARGRKFLAPRAAQSLAESITQSKLTARELEVLQFMARGMRNREIGKLIGTTEETVKVHVKHILEKLEASDRTEAVVIASQRGFIEL